MSQRNSQTLPTNASHGDEITLDGVVYRYNSNSSVARWETVLSKNLTLVTKDTNQSYFTTDTSASPSQTQTVNKKNSFITVPEIDNNFINLKIALLGIEREIPVLQNRIDGEATARTGAGGTNARLTSLESDSVFKTGIQTIAGAKTFGELRTTSNLSVFTSEGNSNHVASTAFVNSFMGDVPVSILPQNSLKDLGSTARGWGNVYVADAILPQGATQAGTFDVDIDGDGTVDHTIPFFNVDIGSTNRAFRDIYAKRGIFADKTIIIGTASITQGASGGIIIPENSSIGSDDNKIPLSLTSTIIDERFSKTTQNDDNPLTSTFVSTGAISQATPVRLNTDGSIAPVTNAESLKGFIGFAQSTTSGNVPVILHGRASGFTNLTVNDSVFVETNGTVTQTANTTNIKVGVALDSTTVFVFSTSSLDLYTLNKVKINRSDLSATNNLIPSGSGSLSYNNVTGTFTFTPPDLTQYATTSYVNTQISNLVDSAPDSLNTLNELAAALNDNENFGTTVTNSLATKAPILSPALAGTPTAPTPGATSNDTSIATTAFVKSQAGAQNIESLTNVNINDIQAGQVLIYDISLQAFKNANQTGGGGTSGTIDFIVDGGTATNVATSTTIVLDGGSA